MTYTQIKKKKSMAANLPNIQIWNANGIANKKKIISETQKKRVSKKKRTMELVTVKK